MDPRVVLDETRVHVDAGSRATVSVRVNNAGAIVEGYTIEVLGEAAEWSLVVPAEVSVFPGEEAVAEVAFSPPASAKVPAGSVPFGIRVRSTVDSQDSAVVEGDLEVGGFRNINARIGPKTSHGRRSGKHHIDLSNWGNQDVSIEVTASDPDEELSFVVKPPVVDVAIGTEQTVVVRVKGPSTFFKGPPKRKPFTVSAALEGTAADDATAWRKDLDASFEQRPLLPRWLFVLVPLAAILFGAAIWWMSRPDDLPDASTDRGTVAPTTPTALAVAATGPTAVSLTWEAVKGADSYNVLWVDPATKDATSPTVFDTTNVPGTQNATQIADGLDPNKEYCFSIQAVNSAGKSPPSAAQCATSLAQSSAPPPGDVKVAYLTDDHTRARVTWTDTPGITADYVVLKGGVPVGSPVPAGVQKADVDLEAGPNCFQVFSKQGDTSSTLSDEQCIDGPGGSGGTTTSGGTTAPGDPGWVAVVASYEIGPADAQQNAQTAMSDLQAKGFSNVAILNTLEYDGLPDGPDDKGFLAVSIVDFSEQADAESFCTDHETDFGANCLVYEPGPPSS
jgi:hypothetical protein